MIFAMLISLMINGKLVTVMQPMKSLDICRAEARYYNANEKDSVAICAMVMYDKQSFDEATKEKKDEQP